MLINEILAAQSARKISLDNEILLNLKLYINSSDLNMLENTILVYGSLCICEEGKKKCVEEGTLIRNFIEKIRKFNKDEGLKEEKPKKIIIASTRGKKEIYENEGIEGMFEVIEGRFGSDKQVIMNILQRVTNTAEELTARKKLREEKYLKVIEKFFEYNKDELISQQSHLANNVILLEP